MLVCCPFIILLRLDGSWRMTRENRECVTIHPFVSFGGDIAMCHVIFKGKGIRAHMAIEKAVDQIPNLLISTNESGSQDHFALLDAYKKFDQYLEQHNIRSVVVIIRWSFIKV